MRWIAVLPLVLLYTSAAQAATCESLTSLSAATTTVTRAQIVTAGAFKAPPPPARRAGAGRRGDPPSDAALYSRLPDFCRVSATLKPTRRSNIAVEVWLPAAGWNGKLQVVGNGAYAGSLTLGYGAMARAVLSGYAVAATDTGHSGGAANVVVHDDVVTDFAYRAIHETTVAARKVVDGFYGRAPTFSYFNGCSTGGRQALTAAQRYPDDFDGIVAGAPAIHGIDLAFGQIWFYQATNKDAASAIPEAKASRLHAAVLEACDADDGAKDGVLENPMSCRFDPQVLACTDGIDDASCLTPAQVEAAQKLYAGASNTRTGTPIHPGLERGSELEWDPEPGDYARDFLKYFVFKDPRWDPHSLDYDSHAALLQKPEHRLLNADDADLRPFFRSGGKLLMYHGWNDAGIPPRGSVNYHDAVREKTGAAADESLRLFMVPGMGHCRGGDGASTFDMVAALDEWVTSGEAPASVRASRVQDGVVNRTRPLCAYPGFAVHKGTGTPEDAENFECKK